MSKQATVKKPQGCPTEVSPLRKQGRKGVHTRSVNAAKFSDLIRREFPDMSPAQFPSLAGTWL